MRTILLASLLLVTACKKNDEGKPGQAAGETKAASGTSPGAAIASASDYEAKATDITNKLLALFVDGGTDCDKLSTNVSKFADDNRELFAALEEFEKANPGAEQQFDDKMKSREKELEQKLSPSFDACRNHAGMKAAMEKLPL